MNSKIFAITFLLTVSSYLGFSQQSMSEYSYIEVPEIYDFQESKDQYQINSLTKFLFNKYGFHAYFSKELPNVTKCDGLYADVETELGFIYTKMVVVVRDCNGVELFRSAEGRSKLKEFNKTYNQALRNAFKSFESLDVSQKEIEVEPVTINTTTTETDTQLAAVITTKESSLPSITFSSYTHAGSSYLLRKTLSGYSLFQEVLGAENDLLLVGRVSFQDTAMQFTNLVGEVASARFDPNMNLTISFPSGEKEYVLTTN
ncbi:hypothetical protein [Rasiella sp. SM2506]|uniref:hypothetical protein n=1 Tax=Rasiella sp. SM2506 TaxID=3423914 RepID=UPI003D7A5AE8